METIIQYTQLVVSVLLIIAVLLQNKTEGFNAANLSGGGIIQTKKRGAEKFLFQATIVLAVLFVLLSLAFVLI